MRRIAGLAGVIWRQFLTWWRVWFAPRDARQARGAAGERLAEKFLCAKPGWWLVARNWRSPRDRRDEIDLVCRDGEVLVFVEVKTRAAGSLVGGYHAVTASKKRILRRAADAYLRALRDARPNTVRFDIVEIEWPGAAGVDVTGDRGPVVRHFPGVPLWPKNRRW